MHPKSEILALDGRARRPAAEGARACDRCGHGAGQLYEVVAERWYVCAACATEVLRRDYRDQKGVDT